MGETFQTRLQAVNSGVLTPLVRRAIARADAEVNHWQCEPLIGGLGNMAAGGLGIYRFFGSALVERQRLPWSLVIKSNSGTAERATHDVASELYWRREILAYQSGLLDELRGGLAAPHCFEVIEYPNQEYWLW